MPWPASSAINARDRKAIKALSAPDIVVLTTVEAYRGRAALLEWSCIPVRRGVRADRGPCS
jgi:hypothetical protein